MRMIVRSLDAVHQVITAFFNHICPTANVCGAFLKGMVDYSFTRCSKASLYGLHARSRIEDPRPILPKLRMRGSAPILIRVQSA